MQYKLLLRIILFLFPKETPESTDEKISKIKANSLFLMKKFIKPLIFSNINLSFQKAGHLFFYFTSMLFHRNIFPFGLLLFFNSLC